MKTITSKKKYLCAKISPGLMMIMTEKKNDNESDLSKRYEQQKAMITNTLVMSTCVLNGPI